MLVKLEYIFVVGSIALIGADRIDFLGGHGPFRLTPFLLCASVVALFRCLVLGFHGRYQLAISPPVRRQIPFLVLLALFLFVSFCSTIFGMNPERGLVSLFYLVLVAALGYYMSIRVLEDVAPDKLVVSSVTLGLVVWLIFCIGGYIAWSHGILRLEEEGSSSIAATFAPTAVFFFAPRLSGYCLDSNRAGFILVMYLVLLDRFVVKTRYTCFLRFAISFFILLAVSRSAMLCWIAYYLFSHAFWKHLTVRRAVFGAAALAIVCSLVGVVYREQVTRALDLWQLSDTLSDRLSVEQGTSGGDHIQLIQRGLETWSTSAHTIVAGIGFAGAPRVLGDFFGDNKYGNFHSLYVSVLAELGLPALLLFMILLGYPIIGRKGAASCVAAIGVFNIALQSYMEPIFWVTLALAWSYERKGRRPRKLASVAVASGLWRS